MIIFDIETGPLPDNELDLVRPDEWAIDKRLKDPLKIEQARQDAEKEWRERAALSAVTGRVLAIGYNNFQSNDSCIIGDENEDEKTILQMFWEIVGEELRNDIIVGFNIKAFDLPLLVRRSWKHGVSFPNLLRGKYYIDRVWDLLEIWQYTQYGERVSLNNVCKFFNIGAKPDDISGADFARLWHGSPADKQNAIDYLKNDIAMMVALYKKLCGA